jgi:hypothetical protein
MPNQFFTYYIENLLMIISKNSGSWGWGYWLLARYRFWAIGNGGTKRGKKGG